MKKRYLPLIAGAVAAAALFLWLQFGSVCIGRIENQGDGQWSHLHVYLNDEITVDFPVSEPDEPIVFQYETGRGFFCVKITDAEGNTLYSDISGKTGSAAFLASSDLTLWIKGEGHGGVFSLTRRNDLEQLPNPKEPRFRILGEGNHTGDTLIRTFECWQYDGKYLNFYIKNTGTAPAVITINGENPRQIPAGSSGHISTTISATTLPQKMTIQCVSDEDLNIYWKAAQRSSKDG